MSHLDPRSTPSPRLGAASVASALLCLAAPAAGEEGEPVRHLCDNSFLIEEAFNQEDGVAQNVTTFLRDRRSGDWVASFTQEWPVGSESHQLSYTLTAARTSDPGPPHAGPGDLLFHYRYQLLSDDAGFSFAPRLSVLVPAGDASGAGGWGLQMNLPLSVDLAPWLAGHTNLGGTWVPDGRARSEAASSTALAIGQGLVLRVHPRFNLLAEALWTRTWTVTAGARVRDDSFLVSPGFRTGFDFSSGMQIVAGIGVPLGVGPSAGSVAVLGYLSLELPFNETGMRNAPGLPVRPRATLAAKPDPKAPTARPAAEEVAASAAEK